MNTLSIVRIVRLSALLLFGVSAIATAYRFGPIVFSLPAARPGCDTPIRWRLGDTDSRFPLDRNAFLRTVFEAETVWERQIGKDLFVYDPTPDTALVVANLFDDRQAMTYETRDLEQDIDRYRKTAVDLKEDYSGLRTTFEKRKAALDKRIVAFERELNDYNRDVARVNDRGGADANTYEALEDRRSDIEKERIAIDQESDRVGALAEQVNDAAGTLNEATDAVRQNIADYRRTYGEPTPFIQGLYDSAGPSITVYQFEHGNDLRLVLAHEFGHALGIEEHVPDDQGALMYAMMGGQDLDNPTLSPGDIAAYEAACAAKPESKRDAIVRYLVSTPPHEFTWEHLLTEALR